MGCSGRNLFKGVHNEIHDICRQLKPCLVQYFKWLLKVVQGFAKGWQRVYFVFSTVPFGRGLGRLLIKKTDQEHWSRTLIVLWKS